MKLTNDQRDHLLHLLLTEIELDVGEPERDPSMAVQIKEQVRHNTDIIRSLMGLPGSGVVEDLSGLVVR